MEGVACGRRARSGRIAAEWSARGGSAPSILRVFVLGGDHAAFGATRPWILSPPPMRTRLARDGRRRPSSLDETAPPLTHRTHTLASPPRSLAPLTHRTRTPRAPRGCAPAPLSPTRSPVAFMCPARAETHVQVPRVAARHALVPLARRDADGRRPARALHRARPARPVQSLPGGARAAVANARRRASSSVRRSRAREFPPPATWLPSRPATRHRHA